MKAQVQKSDGHQSLGTSTGTLDPPTLPTLRAENSPKHNRIAEDVSRTIFATVFIFKLTKRGERVIIIANILLQNIDYYI